MKIYTCTYDLAMPSANKFWVAPNSDFKIGIKVELRGQAYAGSFTLKQNGQTVTADEDKTAGFTTYTIKSGGPGSVIYTVDVPDAQQKFTLVQIVTDSTVFDVGVGGGGDVPADVATKSWVNAQISDFVEEDALTAYATVDSLSDYAQNDDLTAYYTKSETSSAAEISTALEGKQPAGNYLTAETEPAFAAMSADIVVDGDLTAYYTKSETSSATQLADAFAGAGGGGAISAFDMSENPVWSKTQVEAALENDICLPQTIVQYQDNSISVIDIEGTLSGTRYGYNSPVQAKNANNSLPKKVIVGTKVTQIIDYAFEGFGSDSDFFETVILPDSVTYIGIGVFSYNRKLTKIRLPKQLSAIDTNGFKECYNLRIELPDSLLSVGVSPLWCKEVDAGATRTSVINAAISQPPQFIVNSKIYVPDSLYDMWCNTAPWSNYPSIIHRHSELEAPYATSTAVSALTAANSKVTGGAETGTTGTPAAVNAMKSVYETDWETLSATADANTFYVVLPDPA